jgi:sugar phosphate permease
VIRTESKPGKLAWVALILLALSVAINYADRGTLGVAATRLSDELHLGADQLGILLAAFSLTYSLSLVVAAKLVDRWNVNWLYAGAFLLWSMATGLTGLASSFGAVLTLRLLLGMSESVAYPAYSKMMVISFPEQLRGTANALIDAGSKIGPAVGVLLGVKMIEWFSWRGMFFVIGAASLLWLIPWCFIARRLPSKHRDSTATRETGVPSFREILSKRGLWGTSIGLFGGNYTWFFFLNWLPYYFETERHYSHQRLAIFASLPFWAVAAAAMFFGMLADVLVRRGFHAGRTRQGFVCFGLLGCCVFMVPAVMARRAETGNLLLALACVSMGAWSSNHWALTQLLAGPKAAGKWTGLQNGFGNLAGVVGQVASGYVLKATGSFLVPFALAGAVSVTAVFSYWILVGKPEEVCWVSPEKAQPAKQPLVRG